MSELNQVDQKSNQVPPPTNEQDSTPLNRERPNDEVAKRDQPQEITELLASVGQKLDHQPKHENRSLSGDKISDPNEQAVAKTETKQNQLAQDKQNQSQQQKRESRSNKDKKEEKESLKETLSPSLTTLRATDQAIPDGTKNPNYKNNSKIVSGVVGLLKTPGKATTEEKTNSAGYAAGHLFGAASQGLTSKSKPKIPDGPIGPLKSSLTPGVASSLGRASAASYLVGSIAGTLHSSKDFDPVAVADNVVYGIEAGLELGKQAVTNQAAKQVLTKALGFTSSKAVPAVNLITSAKAITDGVEAFKNAETTEEKAVAATDLASSVLSTTGAIAGIGAAALGSAVLAAAATGIGIFAAGIGAAVLAYKLLEQKSAPPQTEKNQVFEPYLTPDAPKAYQDLYPSRKVEKSPALPSRERIPGVPSQYQEIDFRQYKERDPTKSHRNHFVYKSRLTPDAPKEYDGLAERRPLSEALPSKKLLAGVPSQYQWWPYL